MGRTWGKGQENRRSGAWPCDKGHGGKPKKKGPKAKPRIKMRVSFPRASLLFRETAAGPLYLLLDYGKHWDYAKGHPEEGETAWQAAALGACARSQRGIRQVDRVDCASNAICITHFFSPKKGRGPETGHPIPWGGPKTEKVTLSDEHAGHAWAAV